MSMNHLDPNEMVIVRQRNRSVELSRNALATIFYNRMIRRDVKHVHIIFERETDGGEFIAESIQVDKDGHR